MKDEAFAVVDQALVSSRGGIAALQEVAPVELPGHFSR